MRLWVRIKETRTLQRRDGIGMGKGMGMGWGARGGLEWGLDRSRGGGGVRVCRITNRGEGKCKRLENIPISLFNKLGNGNGF